eukprot:9997371-Alexandrium_andersonii.AAC.1
MLATEAAMHTAPVLPEVVLAAVPAKPVAQLKEIPPHARPREDGGGAAHRAVHALLAGSIGGNHWRRRRQHHDRHLAGFRTRRRR